MAPKAGSCVDPDPRSVWHMHGASFAARVVDVHDDAKNHFSGEAPMKEEKGAGDETIIPGFK